VQTGFARELGDSLRTLRAAPGVTAAAMLSLALGIGANTGVYSLLDQVLYRPLPVSDPDRLALLVPAGPPWATRPDRRSPGRCSATSASAPMSSRTSSPANSTSPT
jgi:hypothetical protein